MAHAKATGGCVLCEIDLRSRMAMFEQELTPVMPAISVLTSHHHVPTGFQSLDMLARDLSLPARLDLSSYTGI